MAWAMENTAEDGDHGKLKWMLIGALIAVVVAGVVYIWWRRGHGGGGSGGAEGDDGIDEGVEAVLVLGPDRLRSVFQFDITDDVCLYLFILFLSFRGQPQMRRATEH